MNKIPLVDLQAQFADVGDDVRAAVEAVLASKRFLGGPLTEAFETAFAAFVGADHGVVTSNGTSALYLALRALGIGPGDEVITCPMTFLATVESIRLTGADVVFVDCRDDDLLMDTDRVRAAVTPRTRAVVPVHLYGQPVDMDGLGVALEGTEVAVVEDAAQAHGATYRGRPAGALGVAAAFSFFPGKNLGAIGDGGAVTTCDDDVALAVRMLRDHGRRPGAKYEHEREGFNFRLSAIQAAALGAKLPHLSAWTERRAQVAAQYDAALVGLAARRVHQHVDRASAHHLYVIRVADRDRVVAGLKERGIGAGIHYPIPVHRQPAFASLGHAEGAFPVSEAAACDILSLPLFPEMTSEQIAYVAGALRDAL